MKPYRPRNAAITSRMMAAVRSKHSRAELVLRSALHTLGLRFRLHPRDLPGTPDILFRKGKVAVFVDGDFWHGRILLSGGITSLKRRIRGPRQMWWIQKLKRNVERDIEVTHSLRALGWRVVRLWESDILGDPNRFARRIEKVVSQRRAASALRGLRAKS